MPTAKVLVLTEGRIKEESIAYLSDITPSEGDAGKMVVVNAQEDGFTLVASESGSSGVSLGLLLALS